MKNLLSFCMLLGVVGTVWAQSPTRRTGEICAQLKYGIPVEAVIEQLKGSAQRDYGSLQASKVLSTAWNMHLLTFDEGQSDAEVVLKQILRHPEVLAASLNYEVEDRATPNDNNFSQQWSLKKIQMEQAWDYTTGGVTYENDTIVAAILEKGYYRVHDDLQGNNWVNWGEVSGDGIDNDGNGYVDDRLGYDPRNGGDGAGSSLPVTHGTQVTGIVGAAGNNGLGVTGVNWQVKLLNVSNVQAISEIIQGYSYVRDLRRLYNTTNGAKGSYIVTTNASFGLNNANPADYPLWCNMYDSLGAVGIISVAATTNSNANVDLVGDMPTGCSSPYLITVTNTTQADQKEPAAGFGAVSIDLGAPGQSVVSTAPGNTAGTSGYSNINGCSASTPHVTGALALLYSMKCPNFTVNSKSAPAEMATKIKNVILGNVDLLTSLNGITVTGGRLNVYKALKELDETYCVENPTGELSLEIRGNISKGNYSPDLYVILHSPDGKEKEIRVFNAVGQLVYEKNVTPIANVENLVQIPTYHFLLEYTL